jgi:hypothetical protein
LNKNNNETIEIKALKIMLKEYEKLCTKYEKKRDDEVKKLVIVDEGLENTTYEELQELYGWGGISEAEFDRRRQELEDYKENKTKSVDKETPITTFLKYINKEICDIKNEVRELEFEQLSESEKIDILKRKIG